MATFEFTLPGHTKTFTAHTESKFHICNDITGQDADKIRNSYSYYWYSGNNKFTMSPVNINDNPDILPGDLILIIPTDNDKSNHMNILYSYNIGTKYQYLAVVLIDDNGDKTYKYLIKARSSYKASPLYNTLLNNNPSYFKNATEDIIKSVVKPIFTDRIKAFMRDFTPKKKNLNPEPRNIKVNKYDLDGIFIRTYNSLAAAARSVNRTSGTDLHEAIKKSDGVYRNYKWTLA